MNIYKVSQYSNDHYQAIKSFICYAYTEERAKEINPCVTDKDQWVEDISSLKVDYIGSRSNAPANFILMRSYSD